MDDFKQLVSTNELFSFRVGVFTKDQLGFHASGNFFTNYFPEKAPPKLEKVSTPIGDISYNSVLLEPNNFYEKPAHFLRQADLIKPPDLKTSFLGRPSHWIIASQTCTVENELFAVVLPCYLKDNFCESLPFLKKVNEHPAVNYYTNTVKPNKVVRFLALPPNENLGESAVVVDLCQISTVSSEDLKNEPEIITSLSFTGLSYFQNRLAITLFRDVKGWTDERQLR